MRNPSLRLAPSGLIKLGLLLQVSTAFAALPATIKIPDSTPVKLILTDRFNSAASDISSVVVTSSPDHADITMDGKFLGTTPSTVRMAPGDRPIIIEKSGFKAWQRIMTLTAGGNITLDLTLEKIP